MSTFSSGETKKRSGRSAALCGVAVLLVGGMLSSALPSQAAIGDVTEFPLAPSTGAFDVASGPDGNLWVTNSTSNTISKVTTSGVVTTFSIPTAASTPRAIAAGPDNAMWFTEQSANKIGRISLEGVVTEFPIPTANSGPVGIALGTDNALWFTEFTGNKIGRITTAGAITEYPLPTAVSGPYDIVSGVPASERLYFTQTLGGRIGTVSTVGNVVNGAVLPAGSQPTGITILPNGSVWFVESATNSLDRLVDDATVSRIALPAGTRPAFISSGPANSIWVTMFDANQVWRFTDQGAVTGQYSLPTPGSGPVGLTVGADGNMWIAQINAAKIARAAGGQVPVSTVAPAIGPIVGIVPGTVLTATSGTWSYQPSSYAYQWQVCPTGIGSCGDIPGATAISYTAQSTDNLKSLRVGVAATNASGSAAFAYSGLVSVGTATPIPTPTPGPATGTMASIGNGATAELQAPTRQKRGKSKTYAVLFTVNDAQGTVTLTFTGSGKRKVVAGLPVANGTAGYTWRVPKKWKKGRTRVNATYLPATGSPYTGANMVATVRIS